MGALPEVDYVSVSLTMLLSARIVSMVIAL